MAGRLSRGDVHLYRFAPPDKQRPVLILTRDSAVGHLSSVTVAPISSTVRGVPSEVTLDADDGNERPLRSQPAQCRCGLTGSGVGRSDAVDAK